jgi:hypothetical protein
MCIKCSPHCVVLFASVGLTTVLTFSHQSPITDTSYMYPFNNQLVAVTQLILSTCPCFYDVYARVAQSLEFITIVSGASTYQWLTLSQVMCKGKASAKPEHEERTISLGGTNASTLPPASRA